MKSYTKWIGKGEKEKINLPLIFDISNFLRQNNDTAYKHWYRYTIDICKYDYQETDYGYHRLDLRANLIYYIGMSYYYLQDFTQCEQWLAKAIKAKCPNSCVYYFYSLTLKQLGEDKEADDAMQQFNNPPK